jgi:hypothetical protein
MTNAVIIQEVQELRGEVRSLKQLVSELIEKINEGIFVGTHTVNIRQSPRALKLLVDLGKKLAPEVERRELTEEQLIQDLRRTRKEIFKEVYGDIAH